MALIDDNKGNETICCYHDNGVCSYFEDGSYDLMMKPVKHEGWVNVYKDSDGIYLPHVFKTQEMAFRSKKIVNYIGTIKIEWEE